MQQWCFSSRIAQNTSGGVCTWWRGTQWVCLSSRRFHWGYLQGPPGHQGSQGANFQHCPQCCRHPDWQRKSWRWSWGRSPPPERPATLAGNQVYLKEHDDRVHRIKCAINIPPCSFFMLLCIVLFQHVCIRFPVKTDQTITSIQNVTGLINVCWLFSTYVTAGTLWDSWT